MELPKISIEDAIGISTALNVSLFKFLDDDQKEKYNNIDVLLEELDIPCSYYSMKNGKEISQYEYEEEIRDFYTQAELTKIQNYGIITKFPQKKLVKKKN